MCEFHMLDKYKHITAAISTLRQPFVAVSVVYTNPNTK